MASRRSKRLIGPMSAQLRAALYYARKRRLGRLADASTPEAEPVFFNPDDKATAIFLSNGNLNVGKTGLLGWVSVRANIGRSSGKFYLESSFNFFTNSFIGFGVGNSSQTLSSFVGSSTNSIGLITDGNSFSNGSPTDTINFFTNTNICSIAVDLNIRKIWFRKQNEAWNSKIAGVQNPATSEGGLNVPAGVIFPIASVQRDTDSQTGRFKLSDFSFSAPSGFLPWES